MFRVCQDATNILMSSYEETALISGISDIVVVQWGPHVFKSSPFLVCFGSLSHKAKKQKILVYVNDRLIEDESFSVNKYGYLQPIHPSAQTIEKFQLKHGKNEIVFKTQSVNLDAQIYLYDLNDKIVISDMDGTMTKTDMMGIVSNYRETNYLHEGYDIFMNQLVRNGYKVIWITMRSISLYKFSKKYIKKYIGCQGALIPEPQQFLPSLKKQILKKTSGTKTNMMKKIRNLYPQSVNPLVGGLGNRQNDAIAYLALGIPYSNIYIVNEKSQIFTMNEVALKNYNQLHQEIQDHFPRLSDAYYNQAQRPKTIKKPQGQQPRRAFSEVFHKLVNKLRGNQ